MRDGMSRRVSCVPGADDEFCDAANAALAGIDGHAKPDEIAFMLADLLRPTYPAVVVHRQDSIARVYDEEVWYAYRDGYPLARRAS